MVCFSCFLVFIENDGFFFSPAAPSTLTSSSLPFGNSNRAGDKEIVAWSIGDIAIHKKWGEGTVLEVSGSGSTQELKINFPEVGLKKLLASVAPIEKK